MKRLTHLVGAAALVFTVACGQTDEGITASVKSKLAADEAVSAYQVDVDTSNQIVTLRGDVATEAQKEQAVRLARETDGVRDVIDQLRVNPTAATTGVGIDVDDDLEAETREGADAVGDAAGRGADAVEEGARDTGDAIEGAVTDDDPDTDRDGR